VLFTLPCGMPFRLPFSLQGWSQMFFGANQRARQLRQYSIRRATSYAPWPSACLTSAASPASACSLRRWESAPPACPPA